jgi:hypothetical protein
MGSVQPTGERVAVGGDVGRSVQKASAGKERGRRRPERRTRDETSSWLGPGSVVRKQYDRPSLVDL